jgi:hypothetical protein
MRGFWSFILPMETAREGVLAAETEVVAGGKVMRLVCHGAGGNGKYSEAAAFRGRRGEFTRTT